MASEGFTVGPSGPIYCKILKYLDTQKIDVIILNFNNVALR